KKGSISNVYYKIVNKSGKIFNTLVSAAKLDIGDGNTTIVSFVDITERMKAEEDLKESEKFSKEIINSTADGFSILDENGVHIDVNPAFCKMTGFTKEELIGTGPPHPYWPEKEYKNIEEAFVKTSQGIFESFELVFKKKNGVRFPVLVNPSQIKDEKGNVKSNFAIVMDLTKRKQAEQALKLSEEKYRAIYSNALVGLFRLSFEEGRVLEANQASAELFGYSSIDEFIKEFKSINHYMNPDDRAPIIQELRDKGYINKIDIHSKKKNGTEIWNRASFCVNNEKDFLDCVSIDITERKRAEKEREILLYNMGERVKEISCLYGVANTIQKSNTLEEILQDVAQLIPPGWQYPDITRCKINFAGKDYVSEPFEESDWVLSSDIVVSDQSKGSIKVYYLEEKPEKDEGSFLKEERSLIDGISGIIMRACERKRAEEGREQALREAENANKVKDLFLANMSHEIRTPLNAILGFSQIIEESFKGRMQESEGEYFKVINSSGQRLIRTVHEVLDISRIEAGVLPYNPEVVRLATPIESICNEFRPAASAKKLEFTYASQVDDGTAKVDKSSVVKAVSNLVDNAIKYTKEGQINIQLNKQNGKYVLSISDTGIGIGEDYLGQIYDAFSQESTGYNKKYQGLGLGLSITKSCLDMNGIPITVESKQGVGTTFSLTFTPADTAIAEPETKTKQVDTKTEKTVSKVKPVVLLVEDEPHNRRALEVTLKDKYETPYAVSVTEAKQQLRKHKVDLIILDLSLEGDEDGLDLVAYMKAKKKLKDIPVIAVTAHAFPRDRDNVFNAGCDDYMSKPIVIKELLGMVSKYLK
ncbi:MAG: PAS domain S-box protein, partial [Candidatus Marinimicrobia bacterium]|nr:PAS domain S-box protein [Candidatus Neomarinimicrobiota bacterium]